jgi:hypothetical protein
VALLNEIVEKITGLEKTIDEIVVKLEDVSKKQNTVKGPNRIEQDVSGLMVDRDQLELKQETFKKDLIILTNTLRPISEAIKKYGHTSEMPDRAGTNTDHDVRYLLKRLFLTWSAGVVGNFDDLEMELPYDFDFDDYFVDYTYDTNLDITDIDIYEDATMANHLFNIHLTYNTAGDLTQKVTTRIGDGHTLTRDFAYVSGDLHTIQNTRVP